MLPSNLQKQTRFSLIERDQRKDIPCDNPKNQQENSDYLIFMLEKSSQDISQTSQGVR